MRTRERLHQLVDKLPERELYAAERYLDFLRATGDPLWLVLEAAPEEDEEISPEEEAALAEADEDIAAGRLIPDAELWQQLGHDPRD